MKAAIFNPYLDTLGGGERYTAGIIQALQNKKYKVEIEWSDQSIVNRLEDRFGVELNGLTVVDSINRGDGYDVCFWVSDGSIPTLRARNNILHFQVPFRKVNGKTLINKMKFFRIKNVVVNSEFTKKFIDQEYGVKSKVLYPPVSTQDFKPRRKQNIICYVGRFSNLTQKKRHDVLIDVFKDFYRSNKAWKLVLAGGIEVGSDKIIPQLEEMAKRYPVEIIKSPRYSEVTELMGVSKMFWSAAGYGVNEEENPAQVEHFGITVVEAMAAKAVPLVVNKGGYKEIVKREAGVLWDKKEDLLRHALDLSRDNTLLSQMAREANKQSEGFAVKNFEANFSELV